MSRISNTDKYPTIPDIKDEDIVLGSKGNDKKTRNFKFSDIGEFVKNFFNNSDVRLTPAFDSFLLGFTKEGKMVKLPVPEFQGTIVGNLEGNYYGDVIEENTFNDQDYI